MRSKPYGGLERDKFNTAYRVKIYKVKICSHNIKKRAKKMEKIGIIGVGATKFGELWKQGLRDLLAESQLKALEDSGLNERDINMIVTGNMCSSDFSGQNHLGIMAAEILNIKVPSIKVEAACASGSVALRQGIQAIKSGEADIVMVNGVEKMTDVQTRQATTG